MMEQPFELCDPFEFDRLYGNEKYSLQNMLLKQVNMPTVAYPSEKTYEVWDDRARYAFWDNAKGLKSAYNADAFFAGVGDEDFLAWASTVFTELESSPIVLTGAALVRYTHVMSGYPSLRLTGIIATENPQSRQYGITVRRIYDADYGVDIFGDRYSD